MNCNFDVMLCKAYNIPFDPKGMEVRRLTYIKIYVSYALFYPKNFSVCPILPTFAPSFRNKNKISW